MMFYSFDLDPMTLVLNCDLDMVKMYLHTKNEVPSYSSSKVIAWTDRHTDRQTQVKLLPAAYADGKYNDMFKCTNKICGYVVKYTCVTYRFM